MSEDSAHVHPRGQGAEPGQAQPVVLADHIVVRGVAEGQSQVALREPGFSRTMYVACHRQREASPLVSAVREVAASLVRARRGDPVTRGIIPHG